MKKLIKVLSVLFAAVLIAGCAGGKENVPYDPGTPVPAAHSGTFSCEYGTLNFTGDERSVSAELDNSSGIFAELPSGELEGTYRFVSDLPPHGRIDVRYDTAHELELTLEKEGTQYVLTWALGYLSEDGKTSAIYVGAVTEDLIPIVLDTDSGPVQAVFKKQ